MHQVCGRVITTRSITLFDVDFSRDGIANVEAAFFKFDFVNDQTLRRRIGVDHQRAHGFVRQCSGISNLTTTLRIKRRLIENDLAFVALVK
jgi:hypothetical protein